MCDNRVQQDQVSKNKVLGMCGALHGGMGRDQYALHISNLF